MTALDQAHAAMEAAPQSDEQRLAFYAELADAELFVLLRDEPSGREISPQVFDLEDGRFALAFDAEERLAAFSDGPVPYAALPGRVVARELARLSVGLGLNLGVAPSAFLLPPDALGWLSRTLETSPRSSAARPVAFSAPDGVPDAVRHALARKLAPLGGIVPCAHLVAARYVDGSNGHLLAFEGAKASTEAALAKAVAEALVFSGTDAGALDVVFLSEGDPALAAIGRAALRLELSPPAARAPARSAPAAPGMDPAKPPKLR
ncbi:MAG: SseB family protein [Paracoccaceae bacterium]